MWLFKSKKATPLKELIVPGYVDIHSHVLPGIDDGSDSVETSNQLLQAIKDIGFETVITTPHTLPGVWDNTTESILNAYNTLKTESPELTEMVTLRTASEYFLDTAFTEKLTEKDSLLTLKDNYLLVEMSYLNPPIALREILFEIQIKGFVPVLAHPERYLFYHNDKAQYDQLKGAGCLFQLNLLSAIGYYGKYVAEVAEYLLKNDFIDYTGSDIHHMRHVKSFQSDIKIKSVDKLQKAMEANSFFKP